MNDRLLNKEVKVYKTDHKCNECEHGLYIYGDIKWRDTSGAKYSHKCNNCGDITCLDKQYPIITYKEV